MKRKDIYFHQPNVVNLLHFVEIWIFLGFGIATESEKEDFKISILIKKLL